jgi:nitrite reductase/ring-hydroxylating ferredoxin subunit
LAQWAPADDGKLLGDDEVDAFEANGQRLAIARVAGELYAFDRDCTHEECPLSEGYLDGLIIECPCHGARFDLTTGAVVKGPALESISVYPAREVEGQIEVRLE